MSLDEMRTSWAAFRRKPKIVLAKELSQREDVKCYNGWRVGQPGDFVVLDEEERVMIMTRDNFLNQFEEYTL